MKKKNHGAGAERRLLLPPIALEKDRRFLESVQRYIVSEMEKVGCAERGPPEECYVIYRNAFDKIIEYVTAYKNVLISIKQEYEAFIATVKKGQNSAFFLHGRLKVLASEPTTLLYYRKRAFSFPAGLSLEESLNLDSLSKYLTQLDRRVVELKKEREIKYVPWKKKIELEQELLHLLTLRDMAEEKREKLKLRYRCFCAIYSYFYFRCVLKVFYLVH
uniref:Translin-associated factor X-interacting protein 1 N-terminal domain-containing protein n=1 Tax=Nothoprocta perdicaria TaxID=30464 RepID=A0A8C7EHP2_NOTPE